MRAVIAVAAVLFALQAAAQDQKVVAVWEGYEYRTSDWAHCQRLLESHLAEADFRTPFCEYQHIDGLLRDGLLEGCRGVEAEGRVTPGSVEPRWAAGVAVGAGAAAAGSEVEESACCTKCRAGSRPSTPMESSPDFSQRRRARVAPRLTARPLASWA